MDLLRSKRVLYDDGSLLRRWQPCQNAADPIIVCEKIVFDLLHNPQLAQRNPWFKQAMLVPSSCLEALLLCQPAAHSLISARYREQAINGPSSTASWGDPQRGEINGQARYSQCEANGPLWSCYPVVYQTNWSLWFCIVLWLVSSRSFAAYSHNRCVQQAYRDGRWTGGRIQSANTM